MKILLAYEWCQVGGVESFMVDLSGMLRERGHQCELFFFERGPMEKLIPADRLVNFGDLTDCLKLVQSRGFDIVHANSSDWRIGIAAVRTVGARLVITAHGMILSGWNSTNCEGFACASRWQAEEQKAYTDLPIYTVYNGVDTARFKPSSQTVSVASDSRPIVAWVGRGTDMVHKKIDKLAAIAPALKQAGLRIWIADPYGPEEVAKVVPEAAQILSKEADFWGLVPKDELPQFFRDIAASGGCILSTSRIEGFGLVLAEAQACGCPAIGPDVRGVNEVVDPAYGGMLYPFEIEPEQLAKLIVDTLRDSEGMKQRRELSARFAREKFSLERMAEEYIKIYQEALAPSRKPRAAMRARVAFAPIIDWSDYIGRRWTAGLSLYDAARRLSNQGEADLARRVARLSFVTCPSLYLRPRRLAAFLGILLRTKFLSTAIQAIRRT